MTQPGAGFRLTGQALKKAETDFVERAQAARTQFKALNAAVQRGASKGDAFTAARQVASQLEAEGQQLEQLITSLAGRIGEAKQAYLKTNAEGSAAIRAVAGAVGDVSSPTFDRLVPRS